MRRAHESPAQSPTGPAEDSLPPKAVERSAGRSGIVNPSFTLLKKLRARGRVGGSRPPPDQDRKHNPGCYCDPEDGLRRFTQPAFEFFDGLTAGRSLRILRDVDSAVIGALQRLQPTWGPFLRRTATACHAPPPQVSDYTTIRTNAPQDSSVPASAPTSRTRSLGPTAVLCSRGQRQFCAPVDRVGLSPHVAFPGL